MSSHSSARTSSAYDVLIVDDEPGTLQYYAAILTQMGHVVATRERALGTAPLIIKQRPDFVFLDVEMPGLGGHEIIRVLSRRPGERKTRFVLLSSKPEAELRRVAEGCGADAYICKTRDRDAFERKVTSIFLQYASPRG